MEIETRHYSDGSSATGPTPLPDLSPGQQKAFLAQSREYDALRAYGYLSRLFTTCAPQCAALPDLMGVCTQIDNLIAGYRIRLGELPDPSLRHGEAVDWGHEMPDLPPADGVPVAGQSDAT